MHIALSKIHPIPLLLIPCNPSWPSPHINVSHSPRIWSAVLCFSGRLSRSHKTLNNFMCNSNTEVCHSHVRLYFYRFGSCVPAGLLTISEVWKIHLSGELGICPVGVKYFKSFSLRFKHSFSRRFFSVHFPVSLRNCPSSREQIFTHGCITRKEIAEQNLVPLSGRAR